jgi:diguanylate cyclase (GGDEF)-like protein
MSAHGKTVPAMQSHAKGQPEAKQAPGRRVVVVRDGQWAERLSGQLNDRVQIVRVPGFLAALAEVGRGEVDAVFGPSEGLTGIEQETLVALVDLSPDTTLVLIGERASDVLDEGHGDALPEPLPPEVDDATLLRALGLTAYQRVESAKPPKVRLQPAELATGENEQSGASMTVDTLPEDEPEPLGDTDLVEALLGHHPSGLDLPALAIEVLRQQSQMPMLTYCPLLTRQKEHEALRWSTLPAARVAYQGQTYGFLQEPVTTDPAVLRPWAQWLARWLALHEQQAQLRDLALRDELTCCWNRRYFYRFLQRVLERAGHDQRQVTLMLFDIDDFKVYNDHYGHSAGDEILRDTARLMMSVVREHDVVARIGGDEFAVIFWDPAGPRQVGSHHPHDVVAIAKRFQQQVCQLKFPKLASELHGTLTISGGLATFPFDGQTPDELLHKADLMALESKRKGKNALTFGQGAHSDNNPGI